MSKPVWDLPMLSPREAEFSKELGRPMNARAEQLSAMQRA